MMTHSLVKKMYYVCKLTTKKDIKNVKTEK